MNTTAVVTARTVALDGLVASPVTVTAERILGDGFEVRGVPSKAHGREISVRARAGVAGLLPRIDVAGLRLTIAGRPATVDLAAAIAVLALLDKVPRESLVGRAFLGELSLSGDLRPMRGVLPALLAVAGEAVVPADCEVEAAEAQHHNPNLRAVPMRSLSEVVDHLHGERSLTPCERRLRAAVFEHAPLPGPLAAKLAAVVASGARRVLLIGPPGCGKTMVASRLPAALPAWTEAEALEANCVHSVAGLLRQDALMGARPFRAPHHTASTAALVGGGEPARPGEASLAHAGVLFLDEVTEFRAQAIEALGTTVRGGCATIVRRNRIVTFPAAPAMVVASANRCPCGHLGSRIRRCGCSPESIRRHEERLDRACLALGITERVDLEEATLSDLKGNDHAP